MEAKKKLLISFSGGRTSGYMLWWLLNEWKDRHNWEMVVVFANTGKEASETLVFVHQCSWKWNIPIVWVEAKCKDENGIPFSEKGWEVRHKEIDYFSASRNGEPFEEMISVLGIPSTNAPFCSDQLKTKAIESYLESIGWKDYYKAIGIRYDEKKRMKKGWFKNKVIYPFISLHPVSKKMVNAWWKQQDFDLKLDGDFGNCDGCWKKDAKRLCRIVRKKPSIFNWWEDMTAKYGHINPRETELKPPFHFYRGNLSVSDLKALAKLEESQLDLFMRKEAFNMCSESCEAF